MDVDLDGDSHVSLGLDDDNMRPDLDPATDILVGVVLRYLVGHAPVPEVELVVVGEHLERPVLQPHNGLRSPA
jgi:hypothetical protein